MLGRYLRHSGDHPLDEVVPTGYLFLNRVGLIGRITPKPGQRDGLVEILLDVAEQAERSLGCYLYLVQEGRTEDDDLWLVEAWRNRAMLDAWLSLPRIRTRLDEAAALLAEDPTPVTTVPVGGKGLAIRRTE